MSESFGGCCLAGVLASLVTLLELDRIFYVPSKVAEKFKLYALIVGFVLLNGVLAAGLFALIGDAESFKKQIDSWAVRATLVGLSYLALVRLKIATVQIQDTQYAVGIEALYEGLKNSFYKRINRIVRLARHVETTELAASKTLKELAQTARNYIRTNDLLPADKRTSLLAWVARVENDAAGLEEDRKLALANFILSDRADGVDNT
jgi:hypothetical protein